MKNRKKMAAALCVVLTAAALTVFAAMAGGGVGSQTDPLVTLSYLNDTFTAQIMDKIDDLLTQRNAGLDQETPDGGVYTAITLTAGQALSGEAGCEVLLRSGSAQCDGVLVDTTSGSSLSAGTALTVNHLYLMPESRSITTADGAAFLARGAYTVT